MNSRKNFRNAFSLSANKGGDRHLLMFLVLLGLLVMLAQVGRAQSAVDGFDPGANQFILALAVQPDGKILVGGDFTQLGGQTRNRIARLNPDGKLDPTFASFNPGANNIVRAITVQADGKILVGGDFTQIVGEVRNRIARLNQNGTLDSSFDPGAEGNVNALAVQTDGKILLGGDFTQAGGQPRNRIARLEANGTLDTSFNPGASNTVLAFTVQADGKVLVGGGFTQLGGQPRNRIGRLNADGTLDTTFNPGTDSTVRALAVQADGKILVGGVFTLVVGQPRNRIARLNSDGTLDTIFNPGADDIVTTLAVQADGKTVVGGFFTQLGGQPRNRIARLHLNGTLDTGFNPGANNTVRAIAVQADGRLVIGGSFTQLGGQSRNRIGRLHVDGTLDATLNPGATNDLTNTDVAAFAVQADGKILVGGDFTKLGGQTRNNIARLNPDGTLDTNFNPGASGDDSRVTALAVQPDGKILVGGQFTQLGGQPRNRIGRLNPNGTLDTTFNPGANDFVTALAVQANGKILVGGWFKQLGTQTRNSIGRLNADGTLDTAFNPGATGTPSGPSGPFVNALAVQPDGRILVGGHFAELGGHPRNNIGRLHADGTLDTAFNPGADSWVNAVALQADGKILVGGFFLQLGGQTRLGIGRLHADGTLDTTLNPGTTPGGVRTLAVQSDGKILVGGLFTQLGGQPRICIGRLNANGTLDTTFNPGANSWVNAVAVQADGKIVVGGIFTQVGGQPRLRIGRLTNTNAALQNLTVNSSGTTITWSRSGASPEVSRVTFELSLDGAPYSFLGNGSRISGGWQLSGLSLPTNQNIFIRVRGFYSDNSIVESVRNAYLFACATIILNPPSLPAGTVGSPYSQTISASGAVGPFTFSVTAGALPPGLSLNSATGQLSGNPTQSGGNFSITATDSATGCAGVRNYTITVNCPTITINPSSLPDGAIGTPYSQTLSVSGTTDPVTYAVSGALPPGLTLNASTGVLSGTPSTATGSPFSFQVTATMTGTQCAGSLIYSLTITTGAPAGLQYYPLPTPVRLLDTRTGQPACDTPGAPLTGGATRTEPARTECSGIPSEAQVIVGNATVVNNAPGATDGFITLYPSGARQPTVSNLNYVPGQILPTSFTLGLGRADKAFNIYASSSTDFIVDITGYYAPPTRRGLYYHQLPTPIRLLDTRAGEPACDQPGTPLSGCSSRTEAAHVTCGGVTIPAGAQVVVGNATIVNNGPGASDGYLTLYPSGEALPTVTNLEYVAGQVVPYAFTVSLGGADGAFNVFASSSTNFIVDVTGYYSDQATDVNGTGLLYYPLPNSIRLLDTRPGQPACATPGEPLTGGATRTEPARTLCSGIASSAEVMVGSATVVNTERGAADGYITLYPSGGALPTVANLNYGAGQAVPCAFTVGLGSSDGAFNIYASSSTDFIADLIGYFAP